METFKLVYISPLGERVELYSRPFRLVEAEGLGDVEANLFTHQIPYRSGEVLNGVLLQPRDIRILVKITGSDYGEIESNRRRLSRLFDPMKGLGKLYYQSSSSTRFIEVVPEHVPKYPDGNKRTGHFQYAVVSLRCPDPYWKSPDTEEKPLSAFQELFEFPSDYWEEEQYFEIGLQSENQTLYNSGDVKAPIVLTLTGPVVNPRITNLTTGKVIQVDIELGPEDVLVIDTEKGTLMKNGDEDVFHKMHWDTELWSLEVGDNLIQYDSDVGVDDSTLTVEWHRKYNTV